MLCIGSEISYHDQVSHTKPSTVLRSDSVAAAKVTSNPLSPTEAALDAWNPMESHFLSNWNLYRQEVISTSGVVLLNC